VLAFPQCPSFLWRQSSGQNGISVVCNFAPDKDAVSGLNILEPDRRGILEVFLPGRDSNEFGRVLNENVTSVPASVVNVTVFPKLP